MYFNLLWRFRHTSITAAAAATVDPPYHTISLPLSLTLSMYIYTYYIHKFSIQRHERSLDETLISLLRQRIAFG